MDYGVHALGGAYAIDAVDEQEAAAFLQHLRRCTACNAELETLRRAGAELSVLAASPPPPEPRSDLVANLGSHPRNRL